MGRSQGPRAATPSRLRLTAVLGWTGGLLLALGALQAKLQFDSLSAMRATRGEVVSLVQLEDASGQRLWRPRVAFTDEQGRRHLFSAGAGSASPTHSVGESISVRYDPEHRLEPRLGGFRQLWATPTLFSLLGLGCAVLALALRGRRGRSRG